jgi:hypothetical protein
MDGRMNLKKALKDIKSKTKAERLKRQKKEPKEKPNYQFFQDGAEIK